jgi:hypothetical protein
LIPALLAVALLAAAPAPASSESQEPVRLAAPGFTTIRLPAELGGFYTEHLAQGLNRAGLQVVTAREIQALLGLERQKQLLGCSDEASSCMAELAGALGVDGMVLGDVARVGRVYQLNVKVLPASGGAQLAQYSARVEREEALLEALDAAAAALGRDVLAKLRPAPSVPVAQAAVPAAALTPEAARSDAPTRAPRSLRSWAWAPAAAGGVLGLGGALFYVKARNSHARLIDPSSVSLTAEAAERERDAGSRAQLLSRAGIGLGIAGLVTSGLFYALGTPPPSPQVMGVRVLPTGLSLAGSLP